MGYYAGDWGYDEYRKVVDEALKSGRDRVSLDLEHCSRMSEVDITRWAQEDGYRSTINGDTIAVYFK